MPAPFREGTQGCREYAEPARGMQAAAALLHMHSRACHASGTGQEKEDRQPTRAVCRRMHGYGNALASGSASACDVLRSEMQFTRKSLFIWACHLSNWRAHRRLEQTCLRDARRYLLRFCDCCRRCCRIAYCAASASVQKLQVLACSLPVASCRQAQGMALSHAFMRQAEPRCMRIHAYASTPRPCALQSLSCQAPCWSSRVLWKLFTGFIIYAHEMTQAVYCREASAALAADCASRRGSSEHTLSLVGTL